MKAPNYTKKIMPENPVEQISCVIRKFIPKQLQCVCNHFGPSSTFNNKGKALERFLLEFVVEESTNFALFCFLGFSDSDVMMCCRMQASVEGVANHKVVSHLDVCRACNNCRSHRFVAESSRKQFAMDSGSCCKDGSDCKHSGRQMRKASFAFGLSESRK